MQRNHLIFAALALVLAFPALSIGGEPEPSPDAADDRPTAEADAGPAFEHDVDGYTVRATASAESGAAFVISVVPKAPYHINVAYPWRFTSEDNTYKADAFALTEAEAKLSLDPAESGELRFSVCNDETCLIEKVQVAAAGDAAKE